ncbi:MAG TPA: hypothetical protein VG872_12860 [Acidimicrobiia bacterium]|nr:hypothetical protein [Acidimicrobiia bacterium]
MTALVMLVVTGRLVVVGSRVVLGDDVATVVAAGSEGLHDTIRADTNKANPAVRRIRHSTAEDN